MVKRERTPAQIASLEKAHAASRDRRGGTDQAALKVLGSIAERLQFAGQHGVTFEGKRDIYAAAGYPQVLKADDYRKAYKRNGLVRRLTTLFPNATWRAGAELIEDDDPDNNTEFEESWMKLNVRTHAWDMLRRTDILSQQGRFAVLLIGAPGLMTEELPRMSKPEDIAFFKPYPETVVDIKDENLVGYPFDGSAVKFDPRYGQPNYYTFKKVAGLASVDIKVHWTRVIHLADEALEDPLYSDPRLGAVWNWVTDVEKVVASGSEAYWQKVVPMLQAKLQPGTMLPPGSEALIEAEIDKLVHGLRRWARTFGIDLEQVGGGEAAQFDKTLDALVGLIALSYGVPQRILLGSERGELASSQDAGSWDQQVGDRRQQFAETQGVRPLVDRLLQYGALTPPAVDTGYEVRWPETRDMSMEERLKLAGMAAQANSTNKETILTTNEIRDLILGLDALDEAEIRPVGPPDLAVARIGLRRAKLLRRARIAFERDAAGRIVGMVRKGGRIGSRGGKNGNARHTQ